MSPCITNLSRKESYFRRACSSPQRKPSEIQNKWWNQLCADLGDSKGIYEALMAEYGTTHWVPTPLRSSYGQNLLSDNTSYLARWSEHLQSFFSANRNAQETAILRIPQLSHKQELANQIASKKRLKP